MEDKALKKNIIFTLAYYSALGFALSELELWKFLFSTSGERTKIDLDEFILKLESFKKEKFYQKIYTKKGFLTIKGSEALIEERLIKFKISDQKIKKMKFWTKLFAWIPYLRGIFITGTLAMRGAKNNSDWDILVVTAKNRIWVTRLFLVTFLQVFGKRRREDKVTNRFCLNHYLAENSLIFEERNEFSAHFITSSFPLLGGTVHKKMLQMNEHWIQSFQPNFNKELAVETESYKVGIFIQKNLEVILEAIGLGKLLNRIAKKIMIRKIKKNKKTHQEGADIRFNDGVLIFLPSPHRKPIMDDAISKLTKLCS